MATKKTTSKKADIPQDEQLENTEFDMFRAIEAIDRKDYNYYSRLSEAQRKKFVPFMLLQWMSSISGNRDLQSYYLLNTEIAANKHFLSKSINDHPELQWKLLCAIPPQRGKAYHKWIPQLKRSAVTLSEPLTAKEGMDYLGKLYSGLSPSELKAIGREFSDDHKHKCWLAAKHPELKLDDIETLSKIYTIEHAKDYEKQAGD